MGGGGGGGNSTTPSRHNQFKDESSWEVGKRNLLIAGRKELEMQMIQYRAVGKFLEVGDES